MVKTLSNPDLLRTQELIGSGLTAEVFSLGENRLLKLFFLWVPLASVERELTLTRAASEAGAAAPEAYEIVQVGDRKGIVFERVHGHSMLRQVELKPWTLFAAARQLAELHVQIHHFIAPNNFPTRQEQIERWIHAARELTVPDKETIRRHLARLPPGKCLCHGDFHPGNVLITGKGPVIIDWSGATRGEALADVACTSVLFEKASLPRNAPSHIKLLMLFARRLLHKTYLKRYLQLHHGTLEHIEEFRVVQRLAGPIWQAQRQSLMAKAGMADEPAVFIRK